MKLSREKIWRFATDSLQEKNIKLELILSIWKEESNDNENNKTDDEESATEPKSSLNTVQDASEDSEKTDVNNDLKKALNEFTEEDWLYIIRLYLVLILQIK